MQPMNDLEVGEHDVLAYIKPDSLIGAIFYLVIFIVAAMLLSRTLRVAVHAAMTRHGHLDRTTISFLQQMGSAMIWVVMLILYAHLIPMLRSMGTALLAGAGPAPRVRWGGRGWRAPASHPWSSAWRRRALSVTWAPAFPSPSIDPFGWEIHCR